MKPQNMLFIYRQQLWLMFFQPPLTMLMFESFTPEPYLREGR